MSNHTLKLPRKEEKIARTLVEGLVLAQTTSWDLNSTTTSRLPQAGSVMPDSVKESLFRFDA